MGQPMKRLGVMRRELSERCDPTLARRQYRHDDLDRVTSARRAPPPARRGVAWILEPLYSAITTRGQRCVVDGTRAHRPTDALVMNLAALVIVFAVARAVYYPFWAAGASRSPGALLGRPGGRRSNACALARRGGDDRARLRGDRRPRTQRRRLHRHAPTLLEPIVGVDRSAEAKVGD